LINVAVSGAAGRMGETVCDAVSGADDMELAGRADPSLDASLESVLDAADVVVDFTTPDAAPDNVRACVAAGVHAVVGTTGFDLEPLRAAVEAERADGANVLVAPTSRSAPCS
jgi:4-hydroxy-tetrahydrodipicolinate reductase